MEFFKIVLIFIAISAPPSNKEDINKALIGKWESVLSYEVTRSINLFDKDKFRKLVYKPIKEKVTIEFTKNGYILIKQGKSESRYKYEVTKKNRIVLKTEKGTVLEEMGIFFEKDEDKVKESVEFMKDKTTRNVYGIKKIK